MELICELNDRIILGTEGLSAKAPRVTARAIVKNQDGLYAVMYADKFKLHSLPGGGVEDGEDVLTFGGKSMRKLDASVTKSRNLGSFPKTEQVWTTRRSTTTLWLRPPTPPVRTV